jgi:putative transposase
MNNATPQNSTALSTTSVPRFRLDPTDKVTIDGVDYVPKSDDEFGHVLRRLDNPDMCESFTHTQIDELRKGGKWRHCRGFFRSSKAQLRAARPETLVSDLPPKLLARVLFRKGFCDEFLRMEAEGLATRSDASMKAAVRSILANLVVAELDGGRCGSEDVAVQRPPSPRALRRWLAAYSACAWDAMALCHGYRRSGNRTPRFGSEERALMQKYADMYASRLQPSKISLLSLLHGEITKENAKRKTSGERPLKVPSRAAFERVIDGLDPFHVYAGRESPAAARKKFFIVHNGLSVTRPLERVEIDENRIPLQTLLTDAQLWHRLTPKQQAEVERRRLWVSTAMDTRTRCCLAALVVDNPSEASAVATLEMSVNDKSAYASAAGCVTPWDMFGTGECYANDSATWYKTIGYRSCIIDLGSETQFPTTGVPQMRGTQERFYRTLHSGLVSKFQGRSFENPVAKGNYESEANAELDPFEMGRMIVRWIVDVYHNTPHSGLGGETPRNAWLRLNKIFPVMPPPDEEVNRHIFGLTLEARIGNRGVRFLGLYYQSPELQRLRRTTRMKPVLVRIDRTDLSRISVRPKPGSEGGADTGWISVDCLTSGFQGVSVEHWMRAARVLRQKHADMAKLTAHIVQQALQDIAEFSQMATKRAGIASPLLTAPDIEKFDRDVVRNFDFVRDGGGEDAPDVLDVSTGDEDQSDDAGADTGSTAEEPRDDTTDGNWFVED